jgi:hypothetical protein
MILSKPLPFINLFVDELDQQLQSSAPEHRLSKTQKYWLSFCIMGILLANQVSWAAFERLSLGSYTLSALSWMFKHSKIPWESLLSCSVKLILRRYGINEGLLIGDDSDRARAKQTKRIYGTYKVYDKKTGGYFNGQTIILLLLVTAKITLPVGFRFYRPNPAIQAWNKIDEQLKKQGVKKSARPPKPCPNQEYPRKDQLMLDLLEEFKQKHSQIQVKAILVDALYGNGPFLKRATTIFAKTQVISQLKPTQKVRCRNQEIALETYFTRYPGVETKLSIRGGKTVTVTFGCARLYVKAHQQKRFVVALKYEGEENYRYLVASDMSWRGIDIASAYTFRWLVEVFFEDWKLHEGWGQQALQRDYEGSSRGLNLSLLLDHALLLHPQQLARIENKLPACTKGSLQRQSQIDALVEFIRDLVTADNPHEKLEQLVEVTKNLFLLIPSVAHLNGRDLGRLESTPSLRHMAQTCMV